MTLLKAASASSTSVSVWTQGRATSTHCIVWQGGFYGNALQAASACGHKEIATLLLDKGADVNAQGGYYGNALYAASKSGHKEIVTLLQEHDASRSSL